MGDEEYLATLRRHLALNVEAVVATVKHALPNLRVAATSS